VNAGSVVLKLGAWIGSPRETLNPAPSADPLYEYLGVFDAHSSFKLASARATFYWEEGRRGKGLSRVI
jgi:hypothetical protein